MIATNTATEPLKTTATESLQPGDSVVDRSGGPIMVVASAPVTGGRVFCTWFDKNGNQQFRGFRPETLLKSEPTAS